MSPQKNFNARGPQRGGARVSPGGPGPKGKFGGFNSQKAVPKKKFQPKDEDSENFSESDFDDSEASDLNETPDEDDHKAIQSGKRSLSFAKDVNTASSKKGPAQKTPMPSKLGAVNGKSQPNTPLVSDAKAKGKANDTKKPVKGKPSPMDDDDGSDLSDFGSDMDADSFDDMGSEEEEDSLMGVDEESSEGSDHSESDDAQAVPQPKKKAEAKPGKDAAKASDKPQLKVCGVAKNVAPEKLASFFASKGFKNVKVEFSAPAGCFVATVNSAADASKMKTSLKGADFMKSKLSLLDYSAPAGKAEPTKAPAKLQVKPAKKGKPVEDDEDEDEDDDDDDIDDEELSDEDMDEMESFDEDDEDDDDEEESDEKEILKKANQAAKSRVEAVKAALDKKEKPASDKSSATGVKVVIRGVAKSYAPEKITSFLKSKGVSVTSDAAWEPKNGGFIVAVASTADLDKTLALRGAKLEKFSISVQPADASAVPKKAEQPSTPQAAASKEKLAPASDGKLLAKPAKAENKEQPKSASKAEAKSAKPAEKSESTQAHKAALKGIPKNFSAEKISEFLQSKGVKMAGKVEWVQDAGAFVVSLKSKADLDALKALKGDKIGDKFRFAVADYTPSTKADSKKPTAKKHDDDSNEEDEEDEEESDEDDSLNLGDDDEDEAASDEELDDEEDSEVDEDEVAAKKPKKAAVVEEKTTPPKKAAPGKEGAFHLVLSGLPKATAPEKLEALFKQRNVSSISIKLQDNKFVATVATAAESDKLRAMSGVKFNNFVVQISDLQSSPAKSGTQSPANGQSPSDKTNVPAGQLQFRARLLSIPNDFAVSKLSSLLKSRGVQSVVVTKENGQYVANCQTKIDYNRLLSMKGQRLDDKLRLMVAPMHGGEQQKPVESRKRSADDAAVDEKSPNKKASSNDENAPQDAKKARQVDNTDLQRRQLYIGNIPPSSTDDNLKKAFPEAVAVKLIRRPGARKLFGFVTFDSEKTADLVKNSKDSAGGVKIGGERVNIDFCGDKSSKFKEITAEKEKEKAAQQSAKQTAAESGDKEKPANKTADKGKAAAAGKLQQADKQADSAKKALTPALAKKTAQTAAKSPSKVRFADDVADNEVDDDDEDMDDDESMDDDDEDMSFDDDEDDDDDDDDIEEDDDE